MTRPSACGERGFTLLETMIATAILGLTVVALLQLVAGASDATVKARGYTEAMALAEWRMEELLIAGAERALLVDGRASRFEPPHHAYHSRLRAHRVPGRDLVEIGVEVTWEESGGGRVELVTRALPEPAGAP